MSSSSTPGPETILTPKLAQRICLLLMEGMSLRRICTMEDMPAKGTVMVWLGKPDEEGGIYHTFQDQYARARRVQAEVLIDEVVDIADDGSNDYMTITKGDVSYNVENKEVTNRSKMRIEARKWMASKLLPKKYGDKQHIEHTGKDGEALPTPQIRVFTGAPPLSSSEKEVDV